MLLNKLYILSSLVVSETGDRISAQVALNKEHPLFEGHFPGNPILPGVCTVQIIRELLEKATEKELMLTKASNIKYLGFISPVTNPVIQFDITCRTTEAGTINCSAVVSDQGIGLCSFKGEYVII